MDELGYDAEWQVLNSSRFGVPQNRERVFIVGHLRGRSTGQIFPLRESSQTSGHVPINVVGTVQSDKERMHNGNEVYSSDSICGCLSATDYKRPKIVADPKIIRVGKIEGTFDSISRVYSPEGISPTLDTCQGGGRQVKILLQEEKRSLRHLTPREYWRAQGFPDWAFEKVRPFTSDSQLYKQAGNSVTVPVIEAIARKFADLEISA